MNSQYILKTIRPFVRDNQLTYDDFDKVFGFLPRKEQYQIAYTIQDDLNIELVDEIEYSPTEEKIQPETAPLIARSACEIKMPNKLLIRLIQDGDEQARQDFCVKNRKLIEKIALKYQNKFKKADLIQAGNIGLIKAATEFTFDNETDFDNYAAQIIEQEICLLENRREQS